MNKLPLLLLPAALLALPLTALSDHRGYKEEYWDGNCKVERKFKKNGDYKEERKCKGGAPAYVVPAPVQVPVPVGPIIGPVIEPGITIQGQVRL
ncbi:hypothetical protein [Ramlibacter sp. 2FC]|uniref:hypothetical protein n=1 Tax=Ramlibacter sp. 2FC TaxID=2502188 RepID=UPI0010F9EF7D|nr:hypothetical protein [Ramlibacter sp. 2FC]